MSLTSNFVKQLAQLNNDLLSVKRLEEYYYLHWKHDQSKRVRVCKPVAVAQGVNMISISNASLTLDGVPILRNLSMNIRYGERVAIFGPPSSGKHTIFRLLMGIVTPDDDSDELRAPMDENLEKPLSTKITLFEKDLRLYHPSEIRANMCNLDKNSFIMTGTLRNNLDPDNVHTFDEILEALKYFDLAGLIAS